MVLYFCASFHLAIVSIISIANIVSRFRIVTIACMISTVIIIIIFNILSTVSILGIVTNSNKH